MNRIGILFIASCLLAGCTGTNTGRTNSAVASDSVSSESVATAAVSKESLREDATVTIAFVGDIMMGTTFPDSINGSHLPPDDGKNLFAKCRDIISGADFAGGNLEGSFLDGPGIKRKVTNPNTYYIFRMPPAYVNNLIDAGFDFVGIANNHINDFGEPGRVSTMQTLRSAGLAHAGLKGRCERVVVERNGVRFGIAQVGHGDNNVDINDLDQVREVVKTLRDSSDIVVLSFHGGAEGVDYACVPKETEIYLGEKRGNVMEVAHAAIDAGADVVFGHGPHVVRAAELYKGHPIFYSLGNFCTPYRISISGLSGQAPIAEVTLDRNGKFIGGKIHSFIQERGLGPRSDSNNTAAKRIRELSRQDFPTSPLIIDDDGTLRIAEN